MRASDGMRTEVLPPVSVAAVAVSMGVAGAIVGLVCDLAGLGNRGIHWALAAYASVALSLCLERLHHLLGRWAILTAIGSWNAFLWPTLILPTKVDMWTLPLKVSKLLAMGWSTQTASGQVVQVPYDLPTFFAFGLWTTMPMLVLFIFAQRYLKTGILAGVFK